MQIKLPKLALALATVTVVSGCQTTNPYTGQQEVNNTTTYGGIGALTGAVIGGLVDGSEGALKGAAIGGAAGAGYGYYTDRQEAKLRQELVGTGVQIYRNGNDIQLIMPSNITFSSDQSAVKSSFYPVLNSLGKVFQEYDKNLIQIVGYTDSSGNPAINVPLSYDRAKSVADYLMSQGVPGSRITISGEGAKKPIASNKTSQGRAQNRRVEITLVPNPVKG